jgi:hypothetical protein
MLLPQISIERCLKRVREKAYHLPDSGFLLKAVNNVRGE